MKQIPKPLLHKILFTPLIGTGCLLLGITMYIGTGDRTLLLLSGVLFLSCLLKGLLYYRIAAHNRYEVVCGTCIRIMPQVFGRLRKVQIMDEDGVETTLQLPKDCRFRIGEQYRLFFTQRADLLAGPASLRAALTTDSFLGYEALRAEEASEQPGQKEGPGSADTP